MSELPKGWVKASISDVTMPFVSIDPTKTPKQEFRYADISSIDNNTQSITDPKSFLGRDAPSRARRLIRTGDTLFSTVRTNLKNIALVPADLDGELTSTGIAVLRPSGAVDAGYLFRWACSDDFVAPLSSAQDGTMYPAVSDRDVAAAPIPLPPLSEQRRIVAKIDSLSAKSRRARDHLDHIPRLVERYKQAILAKAFAGELTSDWRETRGGGYDSEKEVCAREERRSGLLRTRGANKILDGLHLADLPIGWNWIQNHRMAVDASNAICAGPFGTIFKAKDFRDKGVPIVFLRHVGEGKYLDRKPTFMDRGVWERQHQPYSIYGGELLVTKLGDPPGTACIYPPGRGIAMVTPDVMKMTVDNEVADTRYLMHFFNSPICKAMIQELAFGLTRLRIDLTMFKAFPIPLAPVLEQCEVVHRIDAAFARLDRVASEHARIDRLLPKLDQAILAKAFRGELVPQDPNDEPASVLLERIRAERQAAPKIERRRRLKAET